MLAALLRTPKPIDENPLILTDIPIPLPGQHEVRIRVHTCGMCHTDLHTAEGDIPLPKLPVIPGHQIVGVVQACGRKARRFREGDRVGVPWLRYACGQCHYCKNGNENLCNNAEFTGLQADGGYAEFAIVNEAFAYSLPKDFLDHQAAPLLCAGVIGYRALRLSEIRSGERLGLFGFGASAHIVIQIARHWNCEVYVFTRSSEHQRHARALGAAWVGQAEDSPPEKLESAIIFAPAGRLVLDGLRVLDKGGTVVLAGITMTPIPEIDYGSLLYHERKLRSVANATRRDAQALLELATEIPIRTEVEIFSLSQINRALQKLKQSRIRGAGVIEVSSAEHAA
ncbi:MAG: zinc-dependent alcohol dehydrogenase family protein [Deltaproteobacteria bacterium]|nr:zinc-dependent alcohol dehydrogenase family protein [Deltaproteobacteria bacterium]